MFFFHRKNKQKPLPPPVPSLDSEEFRYYLRKDPDTDGILLTLSHSSIRCREENADRVDFTAISREILEGVFSGFWVSAWVWGRIPCHVVLPNGQRCTEKKIFSQVFQEYAKQSGLPHPILINDDGRIALFSLGFFSPFFSSYMSDMPDEPVYFFDRTMNFYGYQQPFEPSGCFDAEAHRADSASWDIHAVFDELHDNLLLFIKGNSEAERIAALTRQACTKYGKKLRLVNLEDPG